MVEILVSADPEKAILAELSAGFPVHGFPGLTTALKTVGTKIPTAKPKPDDFVRVVAVGGGGRDLVTDSPTVVLEGWSTSEQRARDITALGVAIIEAAGRAGLLGGVPCYRASGTVPGNSPHPTVTDRFRFTSTISADLRRSAV